MKIACYRVRRNVLCSGVPAFVAVWNWSAAMVTGINEPGAHQELKVKERAEHHDHQEESNV